MSVEREMNKARREEEMRLKAVHEAAEEATKLAKQVSLFAYYFLVWLIFIVKINHCRLSYYYQIVKSILTHYVVIIRYLFSLDKIMSLKVN